MLQLKFDIKLFILLFFGFIISTIVGTVFHEFGHYVVAKYLGYSAKVSYGYTNWNKKGTGQFIDSTYLNYSKEIESGLDFPNKDKFQLIQHKQAKDAFWITFGGPLQTMLTGTLAFLLVFFQREKIRTTNVLLFSQWIIIFLGLFWLRQFANFIMWIAGYIFKGQFSLYGDEIKLALSLGLPMGAILIITAIIALGLSGYIIFKILPGKIKLTFILAGILGGVFGYYFWLFWIGPMLLP